MTKFLPVTMDEVYESGLWALDFIYVSGDAYIDHPSFGNAVITRFTQSRGFSVGVIAQPLNDEDYMRLGEPVKAFLVGSGVVDSMVNNYTVALKKRDRDVYSEGGRTGKRPDRALQVYCQNLKRLYPGVPIIIGGVEASLRRLAHYDYWSDSVKPSILKDTGADLLIYGMGEVPLDDILKLAEKNIPVSKMHGIRGTAYLTSESEAGADVKKAIAEGERENYLMLSSFERVRSDKKLYFKAFNAAHENTDYITAKGLIQKQEYTDYVVVNPPAKPMSSELMDEVYNLPYARSQHPMYQEKVPALEEVEFSITAHRGCFGDCNFCALTYHQGKVIQSRSDENIVAEAELLTRLPGFKGYIHDVGGPSANFHEPACEKQKTAGVCKNSRCIGTKSCQNLRVSHVKYLNLLRKVRAVKNVKKVFVRSGVRFDYAMMDKDKSFINELIKYHVSGQLKVAPEHCCDTVLSYMNKPSFEVYKKFFDEFYDKTAKFGLKQYLVPYFISSHPGSTLEDAVKLTEYLMSIGYMPEQVQDFYPTPSTLSTTMYYTETDAEGKPVFVAKSKEAKAMQRALMQYAYKSNLPLVTKALRLTGRTDLLGQIQKHLK